MAPLLPRVSSALAPLGLLALLGAVGAAQASTPVLVAGFQPETRQDTGLASMVGAVMELQLAELPELSLIPLDTVPPMAGTDVRLYLESCPDGQAVGCAFVVSQHAGADFAITGTIGVAGDGVRVGLSLVDVGEAREAVGLELELPPGQDQLLLQQVAGLLGRVISGELGQLEDIRREGVYDAAETRELVQEELEELAAETGAALRLDSLTTGLDVVQPGFTPAQLEAMRETEGLTEWERLGMSERSYLAYRNSGLDLQSWRSLSRGRMLQLLIRPRAGLIFGPVDGGYYGSFYQDISLGLEDSFLETYATQAAEAGLGGGYGIDLGLGLTPSVEVEAGIGRLHGRYHTTIVMEEPDQSIRPTDELQGGNSSLLLHAGLRLAPFPTRKIRPVLGGGVMLWRGTQVTDHVDLSSLTVELPVFDAPTLMGAHGLAGLEFFLGPHFDLVIQLPLMILVGDHASVHDEGVDLLTDKPEPAGAMPLATGLELGLQMRLGGRDPSKRGPRAGQLEDEDELELLD